MHPIFCIHCGMAKKPSYCIKHPMPAVADGLCCVFNHYKRAAYEYEPAHTQMQERRRVELGAAGIATHTPDH